MELCQLFQLYGYTSHISELVWIFSFELLSKLGEVIDVISLCLDKLTQSIPEDTRLYGL